MKSLFPLVVLLACGGATIDLGGTGDTGLDTSTVDTGTPQTGHYAWEHGVEEVPSIEDPSAILFDMSHIPEFSIELSDEAFRALRNDPYTWVEGSFSYKGRTWGNVGVRLKGENSFLPIDEKPSLKIKFDKYVDGGEFYGLEELTLNNMSGDYSMMHESLAYRLYREAGVPAARAHHASVTINGEPYGLYANVENVDQRMMARWFEDTAGPLFEVWDVDFYDYYVPYFELEYGPDDRTNIQGVADAFEESGEAAMQQAKEHLDLDAFINYWAVGMYVGQFDSYPYSNPGDDCHIYNNPTTDTLVFIPHGEDETFYYASTYVAQANGIVGQRCLDSAPCLSDLKQRVREVIEIADDIDMLGIFDEVRALIDPYVRSDSHRPYSLDYVEYYQDLMRTMIRQREGELTDQLDL
jgi:hypothetical protein